MIQLNLRIIILLINFKKFNYMSYESFSFLFYDPGYSYKYSLTLFVRI